MKKLFILLILLTVSSSVYAGCIGRRHVPGTQGTTELCQAAHSKVQLTKKYQAAEGITQKVEVNVDTQSGKNSKEYQNDVQVGEIPKTTWSLAMRWNGYFIPHGGDEMQMAQNPMMVNALGLTWWMNKRFGFGAMMENYSLSGKNWDATITKEATYETETVTWTDSDGVEQTEDREVEKTPATTSGEGYDSMRKQRLIYYVVYEHPLNAQKDWTFYLKGGSAIEVTSVTYADKEGDDVTVERPMYYDLGFNKVTSGARYGAGVRFISGSNDADQKIDSINIGDAAFYLGVDFDIGSNYL